MGRAFFLPPTVRTNVLFRRSGKNVMLGMKQVRKLGKRMTRVALAQRNAVRWRASHKNGASV
jgi:hypothetical protein